MDTLDGLKAKLDGAKSVESLTGTGERLVNDSERLVENLQLLLGRNDNDTLQKLVLEAYNSNEELQRQADKLRQLLSQPREAEKEEERAAESARQLLLTTSSVIMQLLRSSELRWDLSQLLILMQDLLSPPQRFQFKFQQQAPAATATLRQTHLHRSRFAAGHRRHVEDRTARREEEKEENLSMPHKKRLKGGATSKICIVI